MQDVQERLSLHPLTAPILGNDHAEFRRRGIPVGQLSLLFEQLYKILLILRDKVVLKAFSDVRR